MQNISRKKKTIKLFELTKHFVDVNEDINLVPGLISAGVGSRFSIRAAVKHNE